MIEPTEEEKKLILEEIKDHSNYWGSDRCKRITVEEHLETPPRECHKGRKPLENATEKIDWMIENKQIVFFPWKNRRLPTMRTEDLDKDGLEVREGIRVGADAHYGIITDETKWAHLIKSAGLLNKKPFKTITIVPLIALKRHKIADVCQEKKHAVKIGEGFYSSIYLAELCKIMGTQNVELYQEGKDNPLGIKTKTYNQKGIIAPILIDADVETVAERQLAESHIARIPTLDKIIDDYFAGKKPEEEPKFSLKTWAKKA